MFGTCFEHLKATCNRGKPETCQQQEQLQTKRKQSKKKGRTVQKKDNRKRSCLLCSDVPVSEEGNANDCKRVMKWSLQTENLKKFDGLFPIYIFTNLKPAFGLSKDTTIQYEPKLL